MQSGPVSECMCPDVSAKEVLSVNGGGDIGENGLYVAFDRSHGGIGFLRRTGLLWRSGTLYNSSHYVGSGV